MGRISDHPAGAVKSVSKAGAMNEEILKALSEGLSESVSQSPEEELEFPVRLFYVSKSYKPRDSFTSTSCGTDRSLLFLMC